MRWAAPNRWSATQAARVATSREESSSLSLLPLLLLLHSPLPPSHSHSLSLSLSLSLKGHLRHDHQQRDTISPTRLGKRAHQVPAMKRCQRPCGARREDVAPEAGIQGVLRHGVN